MAIAACFGLASCVDFTNGVVDTPLQNDARLIGYWQLVDSEGRGSLLIQPDGPFALEITLFEDAACRKADHFSATRTTIAGADFLDVVPAGQDHPSHYPIAFAMPADDQLFLAPPGGDAAQDVADGKLSGTIQKGQPISFTNVTASTAELRRWVAAHPASLQKKSLQAKRLDISDAPHCEAL